jgi:hypothetical protein
VLIKPSCTAGLMAVGNRSAVVDVEKRRADIARSTGDGLRRVQLFAILLGNALQENKMSFNRY